MTYDIFLTHAWRYHDDWNRFVSLLDGVEGFEWRNFSLPWYDPAFDPRTPVGERMVLKSLEAQIAPAHCCIVLASVFETRSARQWVDLEIGIARRLGKPLLGAPPHNGTSLPAELEQLIDRVIPWEGAAAVRTIKEEVAKPR